MQYSSNLCFPEKSAEKHSLESNGKKPLISYLMLSTMEALNNELEIFNNMALAHGLRSPLELLTQQDLGFSHSEKNQIQEAFTSDRSNLGFYSG